MRLWNGSRSTLPTSGKETRPSSMAKRLRLRGTILSRLGRETEGMKDVETSNQIFLTNRPQKWFYELGYYPCDIHFLD